MSIIGCAGNNIGVITPPYPDGIEIVGEALIDPDNFRDENGWAQSLVKIGDYYCLWLEKFYRRVEKKAYFKVVNELKLPQITKGYDYILASCGKTELDANRSDITALVARDKSGEQSNKIIRAWKADTDAQRIIEISVENMRCYSEGWGL